MLCVVVSFDGPVEGKRQRRAAVSRARGSRPKTFLKTQMYGRDEGRTTQMDGWGSVWFKIFFFAKEQ
jgi:hypothetical protein